MNGGVDVPEPEVTFERQPGWLQVTLRGATGQVEATIEQWRRIGDEVRRTGQKRLLVVDESIGEPLASEDIDACAEVLVPEFPTDARVAYVSGAVDRHAGAEYAAMLSRRAGHVTMVFGDRRSAEIWLRYGGR